MDKHCLLASRVAPVNGAAVSKIFASQRTEIKFQEIEIHEFKDQSLAETFSRKITQHDILRILAPLYPHSEAKIENIFLISQLGKLRALY